MSNPIKPTRATAFTLIELVTVIVILSVVAVAVGGPTMAYIDSIRTRSAAGRLLADIRFVQRYAMSSRQRTWIEFDAGADSYQIFAEDLANPGKAGRLPLKHPLDQSTSEVQFGAGAFANVGIASANINSTDELEFDSFGVPYDGVMSTLTANATVSLTNGVTITVYPVSGFAEQSG